MSGVIGGSGDSMLQAAQSAADWDDTLDITIGTDDVDLPSSYPTYLCKGIQNLGSSAATVKYRTRNDMAEADQTMELPNQGDFSGKQPILKTIRGSNNGSTSGATLKLYFQKRG